MQNNAFNPWGPLTLVTGGPIQVVTLNNLQATSYRIRNVSTTNAYISWGAALASGNAPAITCVAPTITVSSVNTIGMVASSVEVFCLPASAWFQAGTGGTFEIIAGEGL
jgi:hypothetical protein